MSDNESENVEFGLLVSFTDNSQSFTNGFEAGMIWRDLEAGPEELEGTYHAENLELLKRFSEALGYKLKVEVAHAEGIQYEDWIFAQFTKVIEAERPKPRLNVIDGGLTKHGDDRLKSRLGLNKKARKRQAHRALEKGIPHEKCTGELRKYLDDRCKKYRQQNAYLVVYGDHIYVFCDLKGDGTRSLVTVLHLPHSLRKGEA